MNNIKKCVQLLPYSVGIKRQLGFGVLLIAIGVVTEIVSGCSNVVGAFYIALVGSLPGQAIILTTVPAVVKASPLHRCIAVQFQAIANFTCEMVCFTIVVIIHAIYAAINPDMMDVSMSIVFVTSIVVLIAEIAIPLMYKHYWLGFVLMMGCVMGVFIPLADFIYGDASFHFPIAVYLIASYLIVVVGMLVGIGVSRLLYKRELDTMCYKNMLKKTGGEL